MGCGSSKGPAGGGPTLVGASGGGGSSPGFMSFKVVVVGDKSTGKTCLTTRFYKGVFDDKSRSTIGAAFASRDVPIDGGSSVVRLQLWDTAGQESYKAMTRSFFRDAAAAVVVYDVCDPVTLANVRGWVDDFREQCPDSHIVLVGNKVDKADQRRVPASDGRALAAALGAVFYEASAKTGVAVDELFVGAAETLAQQKRTHTGAFA